MYTKDLPVPVAEFQDLRVIAEGLIFPEGPVVLPDGSVAVVEMRKGVITRCEPNGRLSAIAKVGGGPNGGAIGPDGRLYVCNNGGRGEDSLGSGRIQRVDLDSGKVDDLYSECDGQPLKGPNDIVFDDVGNFWFTDLPGKAIFYASPAGSSIECVVDDLTSPNGIGISPDGATLYWAQTYTRQVMRRRLSSPGHVIPSPGYSIHNLIHQGAADPDALLVGLAGGQELDSLAVEANGCVCVGTLLESGITVITPDGKVLEKWVLPDDMYDGAVTNICFGGTDMQTAYITLSLTGRLISCSWPRPGLRLAFQP